jgi:hypothetical protein
MLRSEGEQVLEMYEQMLKHPGDGRRFIHPSQGPVHVDRIRTSVLLHDHRPRSCRDPKSNRFHIVSTGFDSTEMRGAVFICDSLNLVPLLPSSSDSRAACGWFGHGHKEAANGKTRH